MLQKTLAGCVVLIAAAAMASGQNTTSSQTPQENSQTTARIAPGSIPQQQPAWRPGQPVQAKPSPQVPVQSPIAAANTANQARIAASTNAAVQPALEPTSGASIARPGAVNLNHVVAAQSAVNNAAAIARPVNAVISTPATTAMPAEQPMLGSAGRAGVEYHEGLLSVVAENAELGKLMRLIGTKTGAQIEVAPDVASELVMAHLGPGTPNQVLSALLDSSHLTYIMIGEDKVSKVMIRKRYTMTPAPVVARHRNLGFPEPGAQPPSTESQSEGLQNPDMQAEVSQPVETQSSSDIKPAGEMRPPAIISRSPLMRNPSTQPGAPGQDADQGVPIPSVDVRSQVGGTEAPDQPESNPPQL